jgi:glycosyltransferase involved in cell wall biosynthesis
MSANRKTKVLYIYEGKCTQVGIDLVTFHHLKGLVEANCEIDFLARGEFDIQGISNYPVRITPANFISFTSSTYYYGAQRRWTAWRGKRQLTRKKYDVVIGWTKAVGSAFEKAKKLGSKTLVVCGNLHCNDSGLPENPWPWPALPLNNVRREYELSDSIVVFSDYAKVSFKKACVDSEKVKVISGGVDIQNFQISNQWENVNPMRFIFCGRLSDRKGIFQTLQAWQKAALLEAELWLAGSIPNECEQQIRSYLSPNVKLLGFQKDVKKILQQCHVQILLSNNEGLPKSLMEGAASGLATIATEPTGFPVRDNENGYLVERENINQIAEKMRYLSEHKEDTRKMGLNGRKLAEEKFAWANYEKNFAEEVLRLTKVD